MKKIILVAILFVLIGAGVYAYNFARPQEEVADESGGPSIVEGGQTPPTNPPGQSITGTIKDLLGMGKNIKCTWSTSDEESSITGTAWVSGDKSRTEMKVTTSEGDYESYFVSDGEYAYIWGPGQPGFKFTLEEMEKEEEAQAAEDPEVYEAINEEYNYSCDNWTVDNSKFEVPSDIEFTDMTEMVQQMEQQAEDMEDNLEGICNSLPEPQKTECLQGIE